MDKKILNFHDCILRQCDIDCLQPRRWLNDNIIEFYLQYLSSYIPPGKKDIIYIPPSTTFLMSQGGLEIATSVSESLCLQEYSTIFFALNDNSDPESLYGGTHWSSLVADVHTGRCTHYDSSQNGNAVVAERFTRLLSKLFCNSAYMVHARDCPQQVNGYDCGLFCIYIASSIFPYERIARDKRIFLPCLDDGSTRGNQSSSISTDGMRQDLIELIHNLAATENK